MGLPLAGLRPPLPINAAADGSMTRGAVVTLRLRTGEEIVVEVDGENQDYICGCLAGGPEAVRFMWFETADGCLLGVNLAHVDAVAWNAAEPDAPDRSPWRRDCAAMRFSDGTSMQLPEIAGEAIEYLEGATIQAHRRQAFYLLRYADGRAVSINLETLMCVAMPATWLDVD
jgi:hypothetical protein